MDPSRRDWLAGGLGALVVVVLIVILYMLTKPKDHHLALVTDLDESILRGKGHGVDGKKWMGMIPVFAHSSMFYGDSSRHDLDQMYHLAQPGHLTPLHPKNYGDQHDWDYSCPPNTWLNVSTQLCESSARGPGNECSDMCDKSNPNYVKCDGSICYYYPYSQKLKKPIRACDVKCQQNFGAGAYCHREACYSAAGAPQIGSYCSCQ